MKNKKILIGIIVILVIIVLVNLTILFLRKNKESNSNSNNDSLSKIEEQEFEPNKQDKLNESLEMPKETEIEVAEKQDTEITETIEQENVAKSEAQSMPKQVITKDTSNQIAPKSVPKEVTKKEEIKTQNKTENKQENVTQTTQNTDPVVPTPSVPNPSNPTPEPKPTTDSTPSKPTEEFRVNQSLINQIQNIINSNPSSMMTEFGFNIVVDSSIVSKTTGFTFTETRVKNAVANSFGTIRIYARDYYKNGQLMWNECFIL
ncbi:MAG: hypothetical protein IJH39_00445 [Clostridia bacterium]|nr:hypothetical protein [Clostridia bacterium]